MAICKICGQDRSSSVLDKVVRGAPAARVHYCSSCDYAFLANIELDEAFYASEFNTFMAERSGDVSWNDAQAHFDARLPQAKQRLDRLEQHLDMHSINSVLELGTSTGFLLHTWRDRFPNCTVAGVEPGTEYREFCASKDLEVVETLTQLSGRRFDCLISYFVLEHIDDPKAWLQDLSKYVTAGGKIVCIVPNLNEVMVKKYQDAHYDTFVWQAPHLSYFSSTALAMLFEAAGCKTTAVHNEQRYSLSNHLNWLMGIKPKRSEDFAHVTAEIDRAYAQSLEQHDLADSLIGICSI